MKLWIAILFAFAFALDAATKELTWADLLPKDEASFDDPFAELSQEQLLDLGMIARIRYLLEGEKIKPDGPDAEEEKKLVAKLEADGVDVDWILAQRERVAAERQKAAERVDGGIDGTRIRIPGYMLPLKRDGEKVVEFLLVPWVGACIHTPPPPPNQMIHVDVPSGTVDEGRFAAIWLEGTVELKPASYDLFLVDGTRSIKVAYTMTTDQISEYSSQESDILNQVEVPEFEVEHSWLQGVQAKVSLMFTKTMTSIKDRDSSGPLWTGLLIAFVYGLVHTLGPGHGKAVVISYFVGEGGGLMRGVAMGTKIAIFHVLSAILVVWLTDFAVRQATGAAPADYRMVKLISYAVIAGIGGWMLWRALRPVWQHHEHGDKADHHHHEGCDACAAAAKEAEGMSGWLALAVGSVPCTGALLVLLFGMANDLLGPAILLVVAISAGMAVAMSGIGVLALWGRRVADRKLESHTKREKFAHGARLMGALAVLLIGCGLFALTWATRLG